MILSKDLVQLVRYHCPKLFSTLYIQHYTAIQYRWTAKQDDCYCWKWYIQPSAKVPHMSVHPDRAVPEENSEGLASRQHWNKETANCHQFLYTGIQAKAVCCCNIIICCEVTAVLMFSFHFYHACMSTGSGGCGLHTSQGVPAPRSEAFKYLFLTWGWQCKGWRLWTGHCNLRWI